MPKQKLSAKKIKAQRDEKKFHEELITQMLTLATSGFGFVAALAWNETIKAVVQQYIEPRIPGSGLLSQLFYAVLVSFLAILVTYQLSKLASRFQRRD
jgi:hypothetical protein